MKNMADGLISECDRCGREPTDGDAVKRIPDSDVSLTDKRKIPIYVFNADAPDREHWCRGCIQYAVGTNDHDPAADRQRAPTTRI